MLLRSRWLCVASPAAAIVAAAMLVSRSSAQTGPFSELQGAWSGSGVISANDGRNERIRCRARYYVSPSGSNLDQQLRCASDSYHFDVSSGLVLEANGAILGQWTETTRNASGSVEASENAGVISARIAGPGFTADMTVATRGDRQQVQIVPSGSEIRSVSVDMYRE